MSNSNQAALDMPEHQRPAAAQHPMESLAAPPKQNHGKLSEDQKNALDIHNRARNEADKSSGHARGDLAWDDKLAAHATAYARHIASANQGLKHSDGKNRPGEGENLYWSKPNGSMAGASRGWVDEKKNYHGEKIGQGDFGSYGHYTQVIWPSTSRVGIGMAKAADGGWFVVARYSPPGNFTGQSAFTGK